MLTEWVDRRAIRGSIEDSFEVLDDFLGENVGIGTIFWVLKAFNDLNGLNGWNVLNRLASYPQLAAPGAG